MLLLDSHYSHFTLELVKTAAEYDVIIFCLPLHTTADTQPLDTSCFGPLKRYWTEACHEFLFSNPGRVITKFQFLKLFTAWSKGMSINNWFRSTGVYPFNPEAILGKLPSTSSTTHTSEPEHVLPTDDSLEDDECIQQENANPELVAHPPDFHLTKLLSMKRGLRMDMTLMKTLIMLATGVSSRKSFKSV